MFYGGDGSRVPRSNSLLSDIEDNIIKSTEDFAVCRVWAEEKNAQC